MLGLQKWNKVTSMGTRQVLVNISKQVGAKHVYGMFIDDEKGYP